MPIGLALKCIGNFEQFSLFEVTADQLKRERHVGA